MFSDAEPHTENSLNEPSATSGGNSAAAGAVPVREASSREPLPVQVSTEPASMNSQPTEGQGSGSSSTGADASQNSDEPGASHPAPAETSPSDAEGTSGEPGSPSAEELSEMMDQFAAPQEAPTEGEIVEGRVIAVTNLGVVVDFGRKSEGLVPAEEFIEAEQAIQFGPGQTIEVQITGEHKDGYALLSHQRARRRKVWADLEKAYRDKTNIKVKVVDRVKGGLVVDAGVRAFLPASQAELRPVHDIEEWKDREVEVRVLKLNRKRGNVVVSRRAILEDEQKGQRQKLIDSLAEGQVLHGSVKSITSYGVFVDLGGLDGLLHVSDLSWGRVTNPADVVRPGDELDVQVLKFDREKLRISLGRKQLLPDPWPTVAQRFPAGSKVQGRVVGIVDYGVFVEIEPGVEGLVHVSEMTWNKRKQHPSKLVQEGDSVEAVVLEVKPEQRRISLGLKQAQADPWAEMAQKYPVGTQITGQVRSITDYGAFVEIEPGFDGLIHAGDISWTGRMKNPNEVFKKGETVTAKVLKIDTASRRVSLGIKQLNDIWGNWFAAHKINDVVRGRVSRLTTFGAFVELADGVEGLCHISEIEGRRRDKEAAPPSKTPAPSLLAPGREYDFKIVKLSPEQRKIGLSFRAAAKQAERREVEEYRASKPRATATIGDAILAKRGEAAQ
jgi:small subunit ribosomal protein S1